MQPQCILCCCCACPCYPSANAKGRLHWFEIHFTNVEIHRLMFLTFGKLQQSLAWTYQPCPKVAKPHSPYYVVYANHALRLLLVVDDGGLCHDPRVSACGAQESVLLCLHLTFAQHCKVGKKRKKRYLGLIFIPVKLTLFHHPSTTLLKLHKYLLN